MPDAQQTYLDAAIKVIERAGVTVVILAAVLWMAREAGVAIHGSVMVPLVEAHKQFLQSTQDTFSRIGDTQDKQADTLKEIAAGQKELHDAILKSQR